MQGLKAAFHGTRPQRGPGPRRPGDTLEVLGSEVLELEEIAEQLSRAVGDHDHVRLGQRLQARRQVRRVADDATFLRISRSDQVADHDEPSGDANAHLQRSAAAVFSIGTASTSASPATTARSASCSWAWG